MNRPRGLCWACFHTPAIKAQYPVGSANPATAKFAKRGPGGGFRNKLPRQATKASPGSEKKVRVMMARAERGESVFHPQDNRDQPEYEPRWANKNYERHGTGYESDFDLELREAA